MSTQLNLRIADEQKEAWEARATDAGLSLSDWIRKICDTSLAPPTTAEEMTTVINAAIDGGEWMRCPAHPDHEQVVYRRCPKRANWHSPANIEPNDPEPCLGVCELCGVHLIDNRTERFGQRVKVFAKAAEARKRMNAKMNPPAPEKVSIQDT